MIPGSGAYRCISARFSAVTTTVELTAVDGAPPDGGHLSAGANAQLGRSVPRTRLGIPAVLLAAGRDIFAY